MSATQAELFTLGQVSFSPSFIKAIREASLNEAELVRQHQSGAWENQPQLQIQNLAAIKNSDWVCSSFELPTGKTVWLITEPNRAATLALLEEP